MRFIYRIIISLTIVQLSFNYSFAQLVITPETNGLALAQKLVGNGVVISNVTLTGGLISTGFFNNPGGTNINIDSGIVLTSGRALSTRDEWGLDGNGFTQAQNAEASNNLGLPGDIDLANLLGVPVGTMNDACVLEFDFVPLGDTVKFKYVFCSEEYTPAYVCTFNDAFAFFISGPGITGLQNIALVPGTNLPVSILNVNNVIQAGCINNINYYVDNTTNTFFTHEGHTAVFSAVSRVQPCQTYHLKLVIADMIDGILDSGVFIEAKSLSSNAIQINNLTQTDNQGNSYLVEGCATGSFQIKRPNAFAAPLVVNLSYGGTAINGTDVQTLPTSVVIPANDSMVTVDVLPIVDLLPEGIETLVIYALAGCAAGQPTDSAIIQIRDYDTLGITPSDTSFICKNSSIQLTASAGYSIYLWDANPTLSNTGISNPVATPVADPTTYICTATEVTCNARDSITIRWKKLTLASLTGVNCKNASTGEVRVSKGIGWISPVLFSINNNPYQPDSVFLNLPTGSYTIKINDATGCSDSINVSITQLFPDLIITNTVTTPASCSGNTDGSVTITASGGNGPYLYSIDGINFQSSNFFNIPGGNQQVTVKDNNNCLISQNIFIPLNNSVTLNAGIDTTICESRSFQLNPVSNGTSFSWTPVTGLSNSAIINPVASPFVTTKYFITATTGICSRTDSITIFVNSAPIANAGIDTLTCFEKDVQLNASGGLNYTWSPATYLNDPTVFNPIVIAPSASITYFLSVIDANGCNSLKDDSVFVLVTPPAVINVGNDTTIATRQPLSLFTIDVNNSGLSSYLWSPSYGLNNSFIANPVAVLDRDITYYVSASNSIGCIAFDTIKIKVYFGPELYVPNAFTPNGDGINDILRVTSAGMKAFHYFRIYNRYGQLVFTTSDPAKGWDGKVNGKLQNTGTYIWMAEAVDYRGKIVQRNGAVIIIH